MIWPGERERDWPNPHVVTPGVSIHLQAKVNKPVSLEHGDEWRRKIEEYQKKNKGEREKKK